MITLSVSFFRAIVSGFSMQSVKLSNFITLIFMFFEKAGKMCVFLFLSPLFNIRVCLSIHLFTSSRFVFKVSFLPV